MATEQSGQSEGGKLLEGDIKGSSILAKLTYQDSCQMSYTLRWRSRSRSYKVMDLHLEGGGDEELDQVSG